MTKTKYPAQAARDVADFMEAVLRLSCFRIEVAGSLRRGADEVGDVELLCIPKTRNTTDMFGDVISMVSLLDEMCLELIEEGFIDYRLNSLGHRTFGPANKLVTHVNSGIPVDIFATSKENWGMAMVVRTGPADWNIKMMKRFQQLGMKGHAYGGVTGPDGRQINCPTEQDVFDLLQMDYVEPGERY